MMIDNDSEVALVRSVILHPAGFDLDLFGVLGIRTTDQLTIEVEWEEPGGAREHKSWPFPEGAEEAIRFFVDKRHAYELGVDFESGVETRHGGTLGTSDR